VAQGERGTTYGSTYGSSDAINYGHGQRNVITGKGHTQTH
jgi:hypothetical protein